MKVGQVSDPVPVDGPVVLFSPIPAPVPAPAATVDGARSVDGPLSPGEPVPDRSREQLQLASKLVPNRSGSDSAAPSPVEGGSPPQSAQATGVVANPSVAPSGLETNSPLIPPPEPLPETQAAPHADPVVNSASDAVLPPEDLRTELPLQSPIPQPRRPQAEPAASKSVRSTVDARVQTLQAGHPEPMTQFEPSEALDSVPNAAPRSSSPVRNATQPGGDLETTPAQARAVDLNDTVRVVANARSGGIEAPSGLGQGVPASAISARSGADIMAQFALPDAQHSARSSAEDGPNAALLVRGLKTLTTQQGGALTMRLDPPAIGQVRVDMSISRGTVTAVFEAATEPARRLLEQTMPMLRHALEQQGLAVEKLQVQSSAMQSAGTTVVSTHRDSSSGDLNNQQQSEQRPASHQHDAAGGESRGRRDQARDEWPSAPSTPRRSRSFLDLLGPAAR